MKRALLLLVGACGDPLADGSYRGEPLITLSGEVLVEEPLREDADLVEVGLFWAPGPGQRARGESSVGVEVQFPSAYGIEVYLPPPDAVFYEAPLHDQGLMAMAMVLLYVDENGDGSLDLEVEEVVGAAPSTALIYLDGTDQAEEGPPQRTYFVGRRDDPCEPGDPKPIPEVSPDTVDLVLGDVCGLLLDLDCDGRPNEWGSICE